MNQIKYVQGTMVDYHMLEAFVDHVSNLSVIPSFKYKFSQLAQHCKDNELPFMVTQNLIEATYKLTVNTVEYEGASLLEITNQAYQAYKESFENDD